MKAYRISLEESDVPDYNAEHEEFNPFESEALEDDDIGQIYEC